MVPSIETISIKDLHRDPAGTQIHRHTTCNLYRTKIHPQLPRAHARAIVRRARRSTRHWKASRNRKHQRVRARRRQGTMPTLAQGRVPETDYATGPVGNPRVKGAQRIITAGTRPPEEGTMEAKWRVSSQRGNPVRPPDRRDRLVERRVPLPLSIPSRGWIRIVARPRGNALWKRVRVRRRQRCRSYRRRRRHRQCLLACRVGIAGRVRRRYGEETKRAGLSVMHAVSLPLQQ